MSTSSVAAVLYAASIAAPSLPGNRPDDEITKMKAHHLKDGSFDNPWPSWRAFSVWTIPSAMIGRRFSGTANIPDTKPPTVPVRTPTFLASREGGDGKLRATWLGHACYYVEFPSGLRVLFDPVFQDRCSPLSWLGPKRYTEMPCQIKDIPIIDAVVISHNHYDHLSHPTVVEISKRHPNVQFFVPLGNKKWFASCGIKNCTELDWWEEVDFALTPTSPKTSAAKEPSSQRTSVTSTSSAPTKKPIYPPTSQSSAPTITARISCLPCQHMSARSFNDHAKTLWASWSVASSLPSTPNSPRTHSVFFGGDTGYRTVPKSSEGHDDWSDAFAHLPRCPAFAQIGAARGPFDLGLIPIGAYMPRWIMSPVHANPRDAVEIFTDTKCKRALGIHWGTWVLTEEDALEPPRKLKEALKGRGYAEEGVFDVCDIGESREFE